METNIVTYIGGLVILLFIIIAIVIRFNKKESIYDKEAAVNFLNGLSDVFYAKILEIIDKTDFSKYESFPEMEVDIISQIYDSIWEYTEKELEEASKADVITAMVLKLIDKNTVIKFIDKIFDEHDIYDKLQDIWIGDFKVRLAKLDNGNADLEESFSDKSLYNENFSNENLESAVEEQPTEEELSNLNPPTEEEKEYDPENDSSVEVLDDDVYIDKKGRKRSKTTGRYV